MKKTLLIIISLCALMPLFGQSMADSLFTQGQYKEAYSLYSQEVKSLPNALIPRVSAAKCLIGMRRYDEAIAILEDVATKNYASAFYELYFAYMATYQFDKAESIMQKYIDLSVAGVDDEQPYLQLVEKAQVGKNMLTRVEDIAIIDSVKVSKKEFLSAYRLSPDLGTLELVSTDLGDVVSYTSGRRDRFIAPGVTFLSGIDIYISYRLAQQWGQLSPISTVINSRSDDNYPFQMPDGVTLYFASKGHNSLGGYDIFMSRYSPSTGEYTKPLNIGMPFNSPANDYMLVIDEMAGVGWFATDRFQDEDSVVVYEFQPNAEPLFLPQDLGEEQLRRRATLIECRKAVYDVKEVVKYEKREDDVINFIVDDDHIYSRLGDFQSEDAKSLYLRAIEADKHLSSQLVLLEGMRREYHYYDNKEDKEALKKEILDLEMQIDRQINLAKEYVLQVRRAELKELRRAQSDEIE